MRAQAEHGMIEELQTVQVDLVAWQACHELRGGRKARTERVVSSWRSGTQWCVTEHFESLCCNAKLSEGLSYFGVDVFAANSGPMSVL